MSTVEAKSRWTRILAIAGALIAIPLTPLTFATPSYAATAHAVIAVHSTSAYGSVLVVGKGPLSGFPLYEFSGDSGGRFGCGTKMASGYDLGPSVSVPLTCTGPMSDMLHSVTSDDWPALTSSGTPVAGRGVKQMLLGTIHRQGIGDQVTYGGHPLYLFDPWSDPFKPQGERYMETVKPLAPWHGYWFLVSSESGQPAPGRATVEVETLPGGKLAVAVVADPNVQPIAVTAYSYSHDRPGVSVCYGVCSVEWIPVLTTGTPRVTGSIDRHNVGVIRRTNGTDQVTYDGMPLYLYSQERVYINHEMRLRTTGSAGNGNGLAGPSGGMFSIIDSG